MGSAGLKWHNVKAKEVQHGLAVELHGVDDYALCYNIQYKIISYHINIISYYCINYMYIFC